MSESNLVRRAEIVEAGKPLRLKTIPMPQLPPHMIRIKVAYAGICHSDLHFLEEASAVEQELGIKLEGVVLGHEIAGTVDAIGKDVMDGKFRIGDQVVVCPWKGCLECEACCVGSNNQCINNPEGTMDIGQSLDHPGGYQSHINLFPKLLLKVDPAIGLDVACMLPCSASTTYSTLKQLDGAIKYAIKRSGTARLLLVGAGGLGLWGIILAKTMYDNIHITSADIDQAKLSLALDAGADDVILIEKKASPEDSKARITKAGTFNAAIDFVGSSTSSQCTVLSLQTGGVMAVIGLFGGNIFCPLSHIIGRSLTVIGCRTSNIQDLQELLDITLKRRLSYPKLQYIDHGNINEALCNLANGLVQGRCLIKY